MIDPPQEFFVRAEALGIAFEPGDLERLRRFLELLLDANTRFNLTSITDPAEAWMRHVLDSLTLLPWIAGSEAASVIDVGTGGGLPGVPLAIAMPNVRLTLLEATGKKADFLRSAIAELGLSNADVVNDRAETAGRDARYRQRFDVAISRAVGKLPVLLELTSPFVRVGGHVLAIKGEKADEEVAAASGAFRSLRCRHVRSHRTPTGTIVLIEKSGQTPGTYPRRPGEPKRLPIG